jgi:RNA methyltransferase, TrmH family
MITSTSNSRIQYVRALVAQRKEREAHSEFVVEGVRLVEEALASGWAARLLLYTADLSPRGKELVQLALRDGTEVEEVAPHVLKAAADTENPQGILGVFAQRVLPLPAAPNFLIIADNLRDPGNLGTLLRSSAAAGAQAVLLAPGCADAYSPKVLRAGMGAHFRIPFRCLDWPAMRELLKPACQVYVSESAQGKPCWQLDLRQPIALVVGGEAEGAGPEALALADDYITIPMPGKSESLNAAVAAGVLLFEVVRQRG